MKLEKENLIQIRIDGNSQDDEQFNIKYGITVVNEKNEVFHFIGFENKPRKSDYDSMYEELKSDPEFGLPENFKLRESTEKEIEYFKKLTGY
jgi:hypothetical protein